MIRAFVLSVTCVSIAAPAVAEFTQVQQRDDFMKLVSGKKLTLPLIYLKVDPDGKITGKGARWDVNGIWSWQDGYFCRDINWGGSALGYNCQAIEAKDGRIRFISDKGAGDSATFRLK